MPCRNCPSTVKPPDSKQLGRVREFRATVRSRTEELAVIARYPGYSIRRQVLSSNSVILVFTKT